MATKPEIEIASMYAHPDFAARYKTAEKVTGMFAQPLIDGSGITQSTLRPLVVLDNACGTGIISSALHRAVDEQAQRDWVLTCGDITNGLLEYTRQRIKDEGWPNAEAKRVDAQDTGLPSARYTHIFAGFAFTTFPDPKAAIEECFRILQPGGIVASSTWQTTTWFTIVKSAIETMPGNLTFPTSRQFLAMFNAGWDSESYVREQLEKGGFQDVQVSTASKKVSLPVEEFMELIQPIMAPAINKFWTQAQRAEHEKDFPVAIRRYLGENYAADGWVPLAPVAVIAIGRKPL